MLSAPSRRRRAATALALVVAALSGTATAVTSGAAAPAAAATSQPASQTGLGLFPRVLQWSGVTWLIYDRDQQGPERVPLANSAQAVHVDSHGRLHLRITKVNGVWRSVELQSQSPMGYGTYRMQVDTRTALFDPYTVLGMFIFRPGSRQYTNEIDVEDSRFPNLLRAPNNAQFAVQPYRAPNHEHGYHIKRSYQHLRQQFTWLPGAGGRGIARFSTRLGHTARSPLVARWSYHGRSVPTAQNMHLYLNLWTNHGRPPVHGTHAAVIDSFTFIPAR
jgi:hypothetical protein